MMLKLMPVKDPQQLALFTITRSEGDPSLSMSFPLVERFQSSNSSFSGVFATGGGGRTHMIVAGGGGQTELAQVERVTGNFFNVVEVNPVLGRFFTEDDDRAFDAHARLLFSITVFGSEDSDSIRRSLAKPSVLMTCLSR